jgi:hypothetical protein
MSDVCTVTFVNRAKPDWNVRIKKVYARFRHCDGTISKVERPVDIGPGDSVVLRSINKCVTIVFGRVSFSIEPSQFDVVSNTSPPLPPGGDCRRAWTFPLQPRTPS